MGILFSLFVSVAYAQHISIYDSVAYKGKVVVEVSCFNKDYSLLVEKYELSSDNGNWDIERWVRFILRTKCKRTGGDV